jgi:bifunctional DNase/RNase
MLVKMNVTSLLVDPTTNSCIIVLKDPEEQEALPIWIGLLEANAIAFGLREVETLRPMTHDLMKSILKNIDVEVKRIEISDLRNDTYYATIYLSIAERQFSIDARPSDAIALALRTNAQIFVNRKVFDKAQKTKSERWSEVLDSLPPEDFGKYKM